MSRVLLTGANRGLGLEFTRQYLAEGWDVIAACRDPRAAEALQRLEGSPSGSLTLLEMDVADSASVRRAAAQLPAPSIDIAINCAGIFGGRAQALGSLDYDEWIQVLEVNLLGPARVSEAFLEHLRRGERRLIVTLTSGMGSLADNTSGGSVLYRTSKAAVNMLMRTAAIDLRPQQISCVLLNPGWVKTDMGGPNARITAHESVSAMRGLIAKLGPEDSGRFYNYTGREYPW
jgi:NAD(P)-dependent dehydrogenase (short-subunit alcohol dehydrogenase family)